MSEPMRRCYGCDHAEARYEACLDWDTTPVVLLCDACAIWERDAGSVTWIRNRRPPAAEHAGGDPCSASSPTGNSSNNSTASRPRWT